MENRIGQNSPPVHAAGTDPASVPGLTPPRPAEAQERPAVPADAVPDTSTAPEPETEADTEVKADTEAAVSDSERRPVTGGPVFEVSDRRGSITVDSTGVTFRLDSETAEFDWVEIGAVETSTPWFGRRLTVTVHTTSRRSYNATIEAPHRGQPKQWATELDTALDSYFEDAPTTD
ncbi:hypothetical protein [Streptomyces sp. UNOB3_S3]|uniref:hypothetical protein n=1 Tax=Streptomyces sp. UNOB3_S3 TaxID=2871682 RepID=UPI001E36DDD2|nr:hypothetical protein [Streptomyces sp. UNOB3_S3]MCC3773348.1 hypothetical protein [Streptomyces sp. UNOB3_S3]